METKKVKLKTKKAPRGETIDLMVANSVTPKTPAKGAENIDTSPVIEMVAPTLPNIILILVNRDLIEKRIKLIIKPYSGTVTIPIPNKL